MRKTKKIILVVIAIVLVIAFGTTAYADNSLTRYWDSTICRNQFTTSLYTLKSSSDTWTSFWVYANEIEYTPSSGYNLKLQAAPKTSSGLLMSSLYTCYEGTQKNITSLSYTYVNEVYMLIKNPYGPSGPNMESHGWFGGSYS